jgi:dTDP-4-dehydrorhamnose 3,5-epimerase
VLPRHFDRISTVDIRELAVPHAYEISPILRGDDRGVFLESYRADLLAEATGRAFLLRQGNISVSKHGVARGIHYAEVNEPPTGQAKYFTVVVGSVVDFVVDIRVGSPTFGTWDSVELDDQNRKAVFLSEGLGHLFVVTSETVTVSYLTNDVYRPDREHGLSPLAADIGLDLPLPSSELILSAQDAAAPTLTAAREAGLLPTWDASLATYAAAAALGF